MNILYFSPIRWGDLKQRPQHLAEHLSITNNVVYIEPSISIITSIIKRIPDWKSQTRIISDSLKVIRPSGLFRFPKSVELIDPLGINSLQEIHQLGDFLDKCDIIWVGSPIFYPLINKIKGKLVIYDKMDEYESLTNNFALQKLLRIYESKLLLKATAVVVSTSCFKANLSKIHEKVYVVNNALEDPSTMTNTQSRAAVEIMDLKCRGHKVFGYVGTVDHWFDWEAIEVILESSENNHVVIVGKCNINIERFNKSRRIHYFKPVPKEQIFNIIDSFDICLYPFKINKFLDTINPVKIYEYLGRNKPVLAASSYETKQFSELINLYRSIDEIKIILDSPKLENKPFSNLDSLNKFIMSNTWVERTGRVLEIVELSKNKNMQSEN